MFKVVCIKEQDFIHPEALSLGLVPIVGKIYTVVDVNYGYYSIKELDPINWEHEADKFRPLDETFATEVLEQIKEQIEQEELVTI